MIISTTLDPYSLLGLVLSFPFILGYMPRQSYEPPSPPPPDRRSPEEKEFDRKIRFLETQIEKTVQLKDAYLQEKVCENDLKRAVEDVERLKIKLKSVRKLIEESSKIDSSVNPR